MKYKENKLDCLEKEAKKINFEKPRELGKKIIKSFEKR